jgi:hypothetical protein
MIVTIFIFLGVNSLWELFIILTGILVGGILGPPVARYLFGYNKEKK